MDAPLLTPHELVRPWRRATIAASTIAAVELILLLGAGALLLAKPVSRAIEHHAAKSVAVPKPSHALAKAIKEMHTPPAPASKPRSAIKIMVFNGNGTSGAAGDAAARLHGLGYGIAGTANAARQDYATTVVMYTKGFRSEGARLARDLHVKVVGPLDGIKTRALDGGQLAVIVGA